MAVAMVLAAGAHPAGMVLHPLRQRANVARSMRDGKKAIDPAQSIGSAHALVAVVVLALAGGWSALVFSRHDARNGQLTLLGHTVGLGESEREQLEQHEGAYREKASGDRDHRPAKTRAEGPTPFSPSRAVPCCARGA